jgi:VWFA-related protein
MRRGLISLLGALGLGLAPIQDQTAFRSGTHTVSIYATVVDSDRRLVPNLSKDDFVVYDNGRKQDLTVFDNTARPISIVLMLDRSSSMLSNFDLVRDAASEFLTNLLPADRARIGSFSTRIEIDPPAFTGDRDQLVQVLHESLLGPGPTPLWNATSAAINALASQDGRRVVLLFTDGKDHPDGQAQTVSLGEVVRRSQSDEVMVYAIGLGDTCDSPPIADAVAPSFDAARFQRGGHRGGGGGIQRGPRGPIGGITIQGGPRNGPVPHDGRIGGGPGTDVIGGRGRGDGRSGGDSARDLKGLWSSCSNSGPDPGLKVLADEGGGAYFQLRGTDNLTTTLARVADELHHQYTLGFTASALDGKLHTLDVRVNRSNMTARARRMYLASEK